MANKVKVYNDLAVKGAVVLTDDLEDFPSNPSLGTMVIKGSCLYAYISLGDMQTWYPFATRTR